MDRERAPETRDVPDPVGRTNPPDPADPTDPPDPTEPTEPRLLIDVSPALHDAGHEVTDLGFEGIPDSGPVLHPERGHAGPDDPLDFVNVQIPSD